MSAVPAVRTTLLADAGIPPVLGDRIFYSVAPQGAERPFAVLIGTREGEDYHLGGADGLADGTVTITVVGDTFTEVETAGNAVVAALREFRGAVAGKPLIVFREPVDSFDFVPDQKVHRRILGFRTVYG